MYGQRHYTLGRQALAVYAAALLKMDIVKHAPLPAGPKIIAANHPTTTDPIWIVLITREPIHLLITGMIFKIPLVGKFLRLAGHIPVVDGKGRMALEEAIRRLQDGKTVGIFPEGALSPLSGGVHPLHTGVVRMALATGVPIVPLGIHLDHSRTLIRETRIDGGTDTARLYLRGPYAMTAGEPLHLHGDIQDRAYVRAAPEQIRQRIARLAQESEQRLMAPIPSTLSQGWESGWGLWRGAKY
ncbi:MAG: lysophospholipid acyltransferase family protein [Anaerolineales bacterium]|jgi:1-acyl-sn-glycerol-3-phosphate acyltransferase